MEGILVDILIAAVFIITVGIFTYRGFAKSVMGFLVIIASFIAAKIFGGLVGDFINDTFLFSAVSSALKSLLTTAFEGLGENVDVDAIFREIPEAVRNVMDFVGADIEAIKATITPAIIGSPEDVEIVANSIAGPVASFTADVIGYVGVYIVARIGFGIAAVLLEGMMKLPVLKTLNGFAGFLMGLLAGFLYAWVFAILFRTVMSLLSINYPNLAPFADSAGNYVYSFFTGMKI